MNSLKILWGVVITLSFCVLYLLITKNNASGTSRNDSSLENHSPENDSSVINSFLKNKFFNYLTVGTRNYQAASRLNNFYIESPFEALQEIPVNEDVIALQNIEILNENWKNPKRGSLEVFGPANGFGRILIMKSGYERKRDHRFYQHSFGLSISGSIGLNITDYGSIDLLITNWVNETVGAVYVLGTIDKENVMFCSIHGDYFNKKNTIKLLQDIFERANGRKIVVTGTFYLTHGDIEILKGNFSHKMEKGPFWTNNVEVSGSSDHILVKNCNIVKQPTIIFAGFHQGWLTNAIIDVKKEYTINNIKELTKTRKTLLK